jgi:uncharacterized integral membrane protein
MRTLSFLVLGLLSLIVLVMSVANRHSVPVNVGPDLSAYGLPAAPEQALPLYAVALGCAAFGFVAGALLEYLREAGHRRRAREHRDEAAALRAEIDALKAITLKDQDEDLLLLASR